MIALKKITTILCLLFLSSQIQGKPKHTKLTEIPNLSQYAEVDSHVEQKNKSALFSNNTSSKKHEDELAYIRRFYSPQRLFSSQALPADRAKGLQNNELRTIEFALEESLHRH